ncbi:MAG: helix-turn-helix domain-containing protein [Aristaeellaceae bacterium]
MFRRHSKTYYKYLLSYVSVLVTALLALLIFAQAFFITEVRSSLEEAHRSRLRRTMHELDSDIYQIFTMDYQISSANENFFSYYLEDPSPLRDLRIVNEFKNLLAPSSLIAEIALVDANSDQVYTSTAVYAKQMFLSSLFTFDGWEDPMSDLTRLNGRMVRPVSRNNGSERYIAFINAPTVFSRLQNTVLMFFVREEYFLSKLSPSDMPNQQGVILDSAGQPILSSFPLTEDLSGCGGALRCNGQKYLVYQESSSVMDWTCYFLLPAGETLAPLYRAQVTLSVFLLAVLAAGALVIYYAMKLNYRPIRELTESLGRSGTDDLESLKDAISSLSAQNERMHAQLMSSPDGQALKDSLLFSLLKGKFGSFEAYNREAAPLGMAFTRPCYQVLMLRLFDQEAELPRQTLSSIFTECLGDDFSWQFRELFEHSMFVCLVGMEEGAEKALNERCLRLLDVCAETHGLTFSIGISGCYREIERLSTACFEATQAVREHFIRGRHQLIRYSELTRTLTAQTDYLTELSAMAGQTPQQQMQTVRRFVERLKADRVPALLAKSYCNSAVQVLLSSVSRPVNMEDLFTITYLRTADDYLAFMLHMLDTAPEALPTADSTPEAPLPELLARIYACIAESYDDCSFSIQDTAEKLNLSASYLSQYFKQQTGETLTGYVAGLRIRKAQSLLETTTMPLQMVSESVGYYNLNSFIRRFKQITGMTPGEYRKCH